MRLAAAAIREHTNALQILINNAAVMIRPYSTTKDGFENHIDTNHYAHFLLFQELKPLLLKAASFSPPARVINLTSNAHVLSGIRFDDLEFSEGKTYHRWTAYRQSKTANMYMTHYINRLYGSRGLIGLSVHPGVTSPS